MSKEKQHHLAFRPDVWFLGPRATHDSINRFRDAGGGLGRGIEGSLHGFSGGGWLNSTGEVILRLVLTITTTTTRQCGVRRRQRGRVARSGCLGHGSIGWNHAMHEVPRNQASAECLAFAASLSQHITKKKQHPLAADHATVGPLSRSFLSPSFLWGNLYSKD